MKILSLIAGSALAISQPLVAKEPAFDRAEVVEAASRTVEENYFDAVRGREIAAALRADASDNPEAIAAADAYELAERLTGLLAPHDRHFGVTYRPPADTSEADAPASGTGYGYEEELARRGQGFSALEILPGNVGLVTLDGFADIDFAVQDDPVKASADAALAYLAQADAVIIDLRQNGGGSPSMVGYLVSAFVPKQSAIYNTFTWRNGSESEAPVVEYAAPMVDKPLFVLTSPRTGSAAESLAYTLQAAGRATVIGQPSAGAANPGGGFELGQGFTMFVSTGSPVNPFTGGNWEGSGVLPDIATDHGEELRTGYLAALDRIEERIADAHAIDLSWVRAALGEAAPVTDDYSGNYGAIAVSQRNGKVTLQIARRHPMALIHLGEDLFARADWPLERFRFLRDASGSLTGIERSQANGYLRRYTVTGGEASQ